MDTIKRKQLNDNHSGPVIRNVRDLASYNWLESEVPTIVVPGFPNKWQPIQELTQLAKDTGLFIIAQNAHRFPERPMEPLFRALMHRGFDLPPVDIITDRNILRKLFSFIKEDAKTPFSMNFEMVGNTLVICRDETATTELIPTTEFRGFGHEFEKRYTVPGIDDSCCHHRIISYQFGSLRLFVRSQTDAYIAGDEWSLGPMPPSLDPQTYPDSRLVVESKGQAVNLDSILEIKTRSAWKPFDMEEVAPQLLFSQTSKLVWAHHRYGRFPAPEVRDVKGPLQVWEECNRSALLKLCDLLAKIRHVVSTESKNKLVYDLEKDQLVFYKVAIPPMLPVDLKYKWCKRTQQS